MKNWRLHIKTHKSWCMDKPGNHYAYDIHFLPNIELVAPTITICYNDSANT